MKRAKPIRQAIETTRSRAPAVMDRERHAFASLELHIDELVLDGFPAGDRFRIQDAVERELARLMAGHGVPEWPKQAVTIEQLAGGSFKVAPGAHAQTVGEQVARALCGSFGALRCALPARHADSKAAGSAKASTSPAGRASKHEGSSQ